MLKTNLTKSQNYIMRLLRSLGATKEQILSLMGLVENDLYAQKVLSILIAKYESKEEMTLEKMIKIMSSVYNEE